METAWQLQNDLYMFALEFSTLAKYYRWRILELLPSGVKSISDDDMLVMEEYIYL